MNSTFCYCRFSAKMHLGVAMGGDTGIPALEDITNEEAEVKPSGKGKEMTSRQVKLKVPQK